MFHTVSGEKKPHPDFTRRVVEEAASEVLSPFSVGPSREPCLHREAHTALQPMSLRQDVLRRTYASHGLLTSYLEDPFTFDFHVGLIDAPGVSGGLEMRLASLFQLGSLPASPSERSWYDRRADPAPASSLPGRGS